MCVAVTVAWGQSSEAESEPTPTAAAQPVVDLGPSSTTAALCSLLIPGGGHFYVGGEQQSAGAAYLLGEAVALGLAILSLQEEEPSYLSPPEPKDEGLGIAMLVVFVALRCTDIISAARAADRVRESRLRMLPTSDGAVALASVAF